MGYGIAMDLDEGGADHLGWDDPQLLEGYRILGVSYSAENFITIVWE